MHRKKLVLPLQIYKFIHWPISGQWTHDPREKKHSRNISILQAVVLTLQQRAHRLIDGDGGSPLLVDEHGRKVVEGSLENLKKHGERVLSRVQIFRNPKAVKTAGSGFESLAHV